MKNRILKDFHVPLVNTLFTFVNYRADIEFSERRLFISSVNNGKHVILSLSCYIHGTDSAIYKLQPG